MSKLYIQNTGSVLGYSGALVGADAGIGGSISGSLYCDGYSRLVGGLSLAASLQSACGFQVTQSFDSGVTWDYVSASKTLAAGASAFSYEIFGDAVKVKLSNGSSANTVRTLWRVMPIQSPDRSSNQTALVRTTDTVSAALATDVLMSSTTALTPKYTLANIEAAQTDANIVTAVPAKKLRVLSIAAVAGAVATAITFNSKSAASPGTAISCQFSNIANSNAILSFSPVGWFETIAGEGLTANTGAGSSTGVQVAYLEV